MNKQAQRVALKHTKKLNKNNFHIQKADDFSQRYSTHGFDLYYGEEIIGFIEGSLSYIPFDDGFDVDFSFSKFSCEKDMIELWELWSSGMPSNTWYDGIPVFEITESSLEPIFKNKKCGLFMYKHIANEINKKLYPTPFFFIPNYCGRNATSDEALRVWKSLTRGRNDARGDVIFNIYRKF